MGPGSNNILTARAFDRSLFDPPFNQSPGIAGAFFVPRKIDRIHSNSGNNLCPTIDYDGNIGRAYSGV
jgi:hypothetical protein